MGRYRKFFNFWTMFLAGWIIGEMFKSENIWLMGVAIFAALYILAIALTTLALTSLGFLYIRKASAAAKNSNTELVKRYVARSMRFCELLTSFWQKFAPYVLPSTRR